MKHRLTFLLFSLSLLVIIASGFDISSPCDAPLVGGHTGAPGETSCTGCHAGTNNTGPGTLTFDIGGGITQYVPGQTYVGTVTIQQSGIDKFGFSCVALNDNSNTTIGAFSLIDAARTRLYMDGARKYVSHKPCAADASTLGTNQWTFNWQAPSTDVGTITLYVGSLASNHSHTTSGDNAYSAQIQLTPSITGINEVSKGFSNFSIFPNPSDGNIEISYEVKEDGQNTIALFDIRGKLLKVLADEKNQKGLYKRSFNLKETGIEPGMYLIRINNAGKEITKITIL
ncbi:MAG: choice-of-anchor V domain-containing protein [Bacteroidia bacterium]|nr:choice-of-anchor V domain-containing protein [Bacteroidia bacterium]